MMASNERQLRRVVLWRTLYRPGSEYCRLWQTGEGWQLAGTAIQAAEGQPLQANYEVNCDAAWQTGEVKVRLYDGSAERSLHLRVDARQRWWLEDGQSRREIEAVRGCLDVDLGVTPSTNTLPIRRLDLAIGDSQPVMAAWVRFPELVVETLPQQYTRLAEDRYRYESGQGAFTAELVVDELGLVVSYAGGWQREATY